MALPPPPTQASSGVNACDTTRIGRVTPNATLMRVCRRGTAAPNRMALTSMYARYTGSLDLAMDVYLVDGTYELFRHYYALPSARDADGREIGAVRGVIASVLGMINGGATHVGAATDHVIESFRNRLCPGYKTSAGIEPDLLAQFPLLEEALSALGIATWPMVEFEADDALAAAAAAAASGGRGGRPPVFPPRNGLGPCGARTRVVAMGPVRRPHRAA